MLTAGAASAAVGTAFNAAAGSTMAAATGATAAGAGNLIVTGTLTSMASTAAVSTINNKETIDKKRGQIYFSRLVGPG